MKHILHTAIRTMPADLQTPVGIYLKLRDLYPQSALLESSDYHTVQNSFSYIAIDPIGHFMVKDDTVSILYPDGNTHHRAIGTQVMDSLSEYVGSFDVEGHSSANGLFGYTAYDAVRYFDKVPIAKRQQTQLPDIYYILYRFVIEIDHFRNTLTITENIPEGDTSKINDIIAAIHNNNVPQYRFHTAGQVMSPISDQEYMQMVQRGISHCLRGDVFQIVLSRRFSQAFSGDDFNVYRALRSVNPSPYLFYFDFGSFRVFGSSPETHLKVKDRTAYIDPIAGTFRRTGNDAADHQLAQSLLADPKENAEHIMLVDLARNDLARSGGEVSIDFLRQIQFYSHVIHMVSRVKAQLPADADIFRLFAATFPAGTLSGAPKVKAMQLIDEIEPHNRLTYGGCIGHIGFDGSLNQAITIRSFFSTANTLHFQAGAGVTAHSVPQNELTETHNKLGALTTAVKHAENYGQ